MPDSSYLLRNRKTFDQKVSIAWFALFVPFKILRYLNFMDLISFGFQLKARWIVWLYCFQCGEEGTWETRTGRPRDCVPVQCNAGKFNELLVNGLVTECDRTGEFEEGETCSFSCDNGAQLVGPKTLTCHDGSWPELETIGTPMCEFRFCPDQSKDIKGGRIECNMITNGVVPSGQTCNVICADGYKPLGNSEVTCGIASNYSKNIGRCQKMVGSSNKCPDLPSSLSPDAQLATPIKCVREKVKQTYRFIVSPFHTHVWKACALYQYIK